MAEEDRVRCVSVERTREKTEEKPRVNMIVTPQSMRSGRVLKGL